MECTSRWTDLDRSYQLFRPRGRPSMVFQAERNECGIACLCMLAPVHGISLELRELRSATLGSGLPITILQLLELARSTGLHGRAYKLELDEIDSLATPAILHWDLDHYVLLTKVRPRNVCIHDPAVGVREYSRTELGNHFTGVALTFSAAHRINHKQPRKVLHLGDLLGDLSVYWMSLLQMFSLTLLLQVLTILSPLYLQLVIDQGISRGDSELVALVAVLFTGFILARTLVGYLRGIMVMQFSNQLGFQLLGNAFRHLLGLPLGFFERREMGDIVSRFGSLENVKQMVSQDMITIVVDGLFSVLTLALLYLYSPLLASVSACMLLLVSLLRLFAIRGEMVRRQESIVASARQQSVFMENIRSIGVTKTYDLQAIQIPDWENKYCQSVNAGYQLGLFQHRLGSVQGLLYGLENILVIYFGAILIQETRLTLGQLLGFIFLKQHFANSITAMFPKLAELKMLGLELERVADILLTDSEQANSFNNLYRPEITGQLQLQNISFSFPGRNSALFSDVSCHIAAGSVLALSGASGVGKTTLVKILAGMEKKYSGTLLLDGQEISERNISFYRAKLSAVMHNDKLIVGDLAFNIHLEEEAHNIDRLHQACQRAQVFDVINGLPQGFATPVGEMGEMLSAGQVQRVLIARALYREPKLLLLDETLSHLSDRMALEILGSIRQLGVTVVLVSHNERLLAAADQCLVLGESSSC